MVREHGRAHGLAACDAALRAGVPRSALRDVLSTMECWPHSRCVRWCIEHADGGAETYLESLVRDFVLELGIGRPDTQFGLSDGHRTAFADLRIHRHLFEADGLLKYDEDNPSGTEPRAVLVEEKQRSDFLTGFKLGMSRITHVRPVRRSFRCPAPRGAGVRRHLRALRHGHRRPRAVSRRPPQVRSPAVTPG